MHTTCAAIQLLPQKTARLETVTKLRWAEARLSARVVVRQGKASFRTHRTERMGQFAILARASAGKHGYLLGGGRDVAVMPACPYQRFKLAVVYRRTAS